MCIPSAATTGSRMTSWEMGQRNAALSSARFHSKPVFEGFSIPEGRLPNFLARGCRVRKNGCMGVWQVWCRTPVVPWPPLYELPIVIKLPSFTALSSPSPFIGLGLRAVITNAQYVKPCNVFSSRHSPFLYVLHCLLSIYAQSHAHACSICLYFSLVGACCYSHVPGASGKDTVARS